MGAEQKELALSQISIRFTWMDLMDSVGPQDYLLK